MEEILASIRRIIAEDGDAATEAPPPEPEKAPEPVAQAPAAPAPITDPIHEDVLELTEVAPEEPHAVETKPAFEPIMEELPHHAEPSARDERDRLVSPHTAAMSGAAFASMSNRLRERRGGETLLGNASITLEELVRDMLRPMLQEWLDEHLPSVVERLVREEVERISRQSL